MRHVVVKFLNLGLPTPAGLCGFIRPLLVLVSLSLLFSAGCRRRPGGPEVVVYCSLDEPYARPVLEEFQNSSGIRVVPLFDTEAAKSVGLAQRIRAERATPRADVFWSSEAVRLIQLKHEGLFEPYISPAAEGIPAAYRSAGGEWTGFAARARVLVYNTRQVPSPPLSILDLAGPQWNGRAALCNPRIGTAATEAAALVAALGPARAVEFYRRLKRGKARIVEGNSVAAELTGRGETAVSLTDTDDAYIRQDRGAPLGIVFPGEAGMGTLLIPNTAALVRGGPNPAHARKFLDYLLSEDTELRLANLPSRQLPLHAQAASRLPDQVRALSRAKRMKVDYEQLARLMPEVDRLLREVLYD